MRFDSGTRAAYSTDASNFQQKGEQPCQPSPFGTRTPTRPPGGFAGSSGAANEAAHAVPGAPGRVGPAAGDLVLLWAQGTLVAQDPVGRTNSFRDTGVAIVSGLVVVETACGVLALLAAVAVWSTEPA